MPHEDVIEILLVRCFVQTSEIEHMFGSNDLYLETHLFVSLFSLSFTYLFWMILNSEDFNLLQYLTLMAHTSHSWKIEREIDTPVAVNHSPPFYKRG